MDGPELWRRSAIDVGAVIVSVVVAIAPDEDGVTVDGEKLHDAPEGSPEQLKVTMPENPFCGVTRTAVVPACPALTVSSG
jgi:hypothetical protein